MKKMIIIGLCLPAVSLMFSLTAEAQLSSKKTVFTINQPMEIPGRQPIVLAPGTYVIKLLDLAGSRNIVQFFNADEGKLYSTVIGIPDYRLQTPEKAEISFYEAEPGRAHPIRAWFSPGSNYGVEFVYSKERALQVAKASGQHVMSAANPATATPSEQPSTTEVAELKTENVTARTPGGTEIPLADAHPATTETATVQAPESATSAVTSESSLTSPSADIPVLPKTASNLPLWALLGVTLIGGAFSLRTLLS
jgi:hypothetical protein